VKSQKYALWGMSRSARLISLDASEDRKERYVDGRAVPDLERMDERQAREFIEELFTTLSAEREYALRHEDYTMQMPQSGERIRSPENMRVFQQAFVTNSTLRIRMLGGCW
jgi:hypothetical protein